MDQNNCCLSLRNLVWMVIHFVFACDYLILHKVLIDSRDKDLVKDPGSWTQINFTSQLED